MAKLSNIGFDFKTSAAQALRDHPHLRRTTAFFDPAHGAYFEDSIFQQPLGTRILDRVKRYLYPEKLNAGKIMDDMREIGPHANWYVSNGKEVGILAFSTTILSSMLQPCQLILGDAAYDTRMHQFAFTHELGHLIFKFPSYARHVRYEEEDGRKFAFQNSGVEVIADTFAAYAEIAKDRVPQSMIEAWSNFRAIAAVDGDITHYTSPTLDAVVQINRADIIGLSPAAVEAIAMRHAELFKPSDASERQLHQDFRHLAGSMGKIAHNNTRPLEELAIATLENADHPLTLYTGAKVLSQFLRGTPGGIKVEGAEWNMVAEALSDALREIPATHFLKELDLNKVDILGRQDKPIAPPTLARIANFEPS